MVDPLAEVVNLLNPAARFSKHIVGVGRWRVRRSDSGQPFYCVVLEGGCRLGLDGREPIELVTGDFILVPAAFGVAVSSLEPPFGASDSTPTAMGRGQFRIGTADGLPDVRMLIGHFSFGSRDAALLVSLLPQFVRVQGEPRLVNLVSLMSEESREERPARDVVLARFLEVLLIEALRSTAQAPASRGLMRGLADVRLAAAIRAMHEEPAQAWTVPNSRDAPGSRALRFSSASIVRSGSLRWSTCSAGEWR